MTIDLSQYASKFVRKDGGRWHITPNGYWTYCGLRVGGAFRYTSFDSRGLRGNICLRCAKSFKSWVGPDVLKEA